MKRKMMGSGLEISDIEEGEIQEETEIEEGEITEIEVQDSDFDPLLYLGDKVHAVLGHFQKDFEGCISYDNLGTKFGGYGSFLPSHQGSPSSPHTQSAADARENDTPRKLHLEDKKPIFFASPSARNRLAPGKAVPVGNFSIDNKPKQAEEFGLKTGAMKNHILNTSDKRTLKVRINVCSKNMQTQKISEGKFGKLAQEPMPSPTSILQTMTSCPGEPLLSPLSEDLINLFEKRKHRGKCETKPVDSMNQKSLVNASEDQCIKQLSSAVANSSDKGGNLIIKSKREFSTEGSRPFKRLKSEEVHFHENNRASDNAATFSKPGLRSGNDRRKYTGHKDITKEVNVLGTSGEGLLFTEKREDKNSVRKRRLNETCKIDHQTEKKARVSKMGGKDSNGSKNATVGPDRKSWSDKDKHNNTKMAVKSSASQATYNSDAQKAPNPRKKSENSHCQPIRHPTPNSHKVSSSHSANSFLKEAKDVKHFVDRLKNSGSTDANGLYFEVALKFMHGAYLVESGISEATKHNDLMHSMDIYSSTAKLCEFCAKEYENSKEMAAAALVYKCMEVAYMRVVYSSNELCRDRNEMQKALKIATLGGSPSSASDADNLNHKTHTTKAALPKAVGTPQVIRSRNRSSLLCVLNIAQNVHLAMEASSKSRIALTAATEKTSDKEIICILKRAMDFNFQDVGGFLRLVHKAIDAISKL